jgi:hypothetical protein
MTRTESAHAGSTGSGTVVLELGPGMGALVLVTAPEFDGAEIDISMVGSDGYRTHSIVRRRDAAGGTQYAAVYPSLPPGSYTVWRTPGDPLTTAIITSGTVTMTDWTAGM